VRESLLREAESVLEEWLRARGEAPTSETSEGFRLLALHRQGARGVPSFNACRETCREIAYHYNLLRGEPGAALLEQHGIEIGTSFGPLRGRIWRIGTMGYNAREDAVLATLDALEAVLAAQKFKLPRRAGVDAARSAFG